MTLVRVAWLLLATMSCRRDSTHQQGTSDSSAASAKTAPRFEEYAVTDSFTGKQASIDWASDPDARHFRGVLSIGIARGPNFAGHYAIISWGCGTQCRSYAIVDVASGRVFTDTALDLSCHEEEFRTSSRLILLTAWDTMPGHVCADTTSLALVWNGQGFEKVP